MIDIDKMSFSLDCIRRDMQNQVGTKTMSRSLRLLYKGLSNEELELFAKYRNTMEDVSCYLKAKAEQEERLKNAGIPV